MQTSFFSFYCCGSAAAGRGRLLARRLGNARPENTCHRDTRKGLTPPRYPQ